MKSLAVALVKSTSGKSRSPRWAEKMDKKTLFASGSEGMDLFTYGCVGCWALGKLEVKKSNPSFSRASWRKVSAWKRVST
jgi:hypothetical protein